MILDSLPAAATNGRLVTNLTRRPAIRIDGLIVADNRGRGLVLQTMDVVVERCAIQGCTGAGIHRVCDASDFYESSGTTKVRIANNTLTGVNQGAVVGSAAFTRAAIAIAAELDNQLAPAGSHSQIDLVGNTIRDTARSAIHVGSAFQTNIIGNV
ncbi:MAG: hypothetical protein IPK26_30240 [Planctomycetes bacterium]|nr:hypothetical protein [Planctomycetota bacterium]